FLLLINNKMKLLKNCLEYFKKSKIIKIIIWIIAIVLILFIGVVIYRIPTVAEQIKTKEIVADIHNQKLKIEDVEGKNLPPEPNEKLNDLTLEGIDVNQNGIRDDVELAIFKLYPDSARIRSGALQYAKSLQMYFRKDITNSETFVAVMQKNSKGDSCLAQTVPRVIFPKNISYEKMDKIAKPSLILMKTRLKEIEKLVFNTETRKNKQEENYEKYMTSYGEKPGEDCDIDPFILPN
ncbi:MAG: hypothetical protein KKF89_06040, partial [Nanoarchaeota archaeon]|nr:hypothetical protein [Patescibacteria group bacterium]MBU1855259.1 hypothetical protein [Nanoarchaeota archaeon]